MSIWLIIVYCYHSVVWEFQNVCFLLTSVALSLTIFERVRYCVLTVLVTWYLLYLFQNNVMSGLLSACLVCFCLLVLAKDIPHLFCHRMLRLHMRVLNTHHSGFRQPRPAFFHFIEYFVCLWQIRKSWKSNIKSRKIDWLFGLVNLTISLFFSWRPV